MRLWYSNKRYQTLKMPSESHFRRHFILQIYRCLVLPPITSSGLNIKSLSPSEISSQLSIILFAASNPISVTARRIRGSKLSSSNLIVSIQYPFYVVCITIPCQDTFIRRLLRTPRSLYRSQNSIYNTDGSLIFQAIQGANVKYLIT